MMARRRRIPGDPKVVDTIVNVGRRMHVSPKLQKAAIETGLVESGLRNLPGGDADSAGWRQERASLYPDPTNVADAARRFFKEARSFNRPGLSAGQLAAAVQRPAAQYRGRYDQQSAQADAILRQLGLGMASASQGSGGGSGGAAAAPSVGSILQSASGNFDAAGFEKAQRAAIIGQLIAKHRGTDSPLFKTGLLSTTAPNQSDFMATPSAGDVFSSILKAKMDGGAASPQADHPGGGVRVGSRTAMAGGGGLDYPLGRPGRIIGTPYAGTHSKAFNVSGGSDNWQSENAVDIRIPVGTPVYAVADGVLGNTGSLGQGGRFAGLRTNLIGKSNAWYYAHMSKLAPGIRAGAHVHKGQLLGYSGEANGVPHLHFGQEKGDPRKIARAARR